MPVFMADREMPRVTMAELAAAQRAAIAMSEQFTAHGRPVRYLRSLYVPSESRCMCLFEAASADMVRDVNEAAGIPFTRIIEAADLTP
jgi:Protein of unknown function (DUF4242)